MNVKSNSNARQTRFARMSHVAWMEWYRNNPTEAAISHGDLRARLMHEITWARYYVRIERGRK